MQVSVQLFGPQAKLAGTSEVSLDLPETSATCTELRRQLSQLHPELAESLPSSRLAVNHEFVSDGYTLKQNDEIALIGLVSGG